MSCTLQCICVFLNPDRPGRGAVPTNGGRPVITFVKELPETCSSWQDQFLAILPEIESRLRNEFRYWNPNSREEAIGEGIAHCVFAYIQLHKRGRTQFATPGTLVFYAAHLVRRGRPAAGRVNAMDPFSKYAQIGKGIRVETSGNKWIETLVEDKRASVPDQVAAKMDVGAWFSTLTDRMRQIAKDLAVGCTTSQAARKYGVTPGRISQLRRSLEKSWMNFQNKSAQALA
jgi:hypothetical protein